VRVLDFVQRYVAEMDWSSVEAATLLLARTNALRDPADGDRMGHRVVLPSRAEPDEAG
jgi:hypothetical protein